MTTTALTVTERAAVALGAKDYELKLAELVKSSVRIVAITNGDGYKEAHGARMTLKNTRVEIEKAGKSAREDAQAFSKAVIAEEKRLVGLITPEETRLQALQDEWDTAREAERQAKMQAEQARIDGHRAGIDAIRRHATYASTLDARGVSATIASLTDADVGAVIFEEFAPAADKAKSETLAALRELHAAAVAREAEAARLQAEREELARLRAEQEAREAAERARVAAEQKAEAERLAIERQKFEEEQRIARERQAEAERIAASARAAEQAKLDAERAEIKRQQDAIAAEQRRQQEAREAAERAEAERIAAEVRKAEAERIKAQEAEAARMRAIEEEKRRQADVATQKTRAIRREIDAVLDQLAADQLVAVLKFAAEMAHKEAA